MLYARGPLEVRCWCASDLLWIRSVIESVVHCGTLLFTCRFFRMRAIRGSHTCLPFSHLPAAARDRRHLLCRSSLRENVSAAPDSLRVKNQEFQDEPEERSVRTQNIRVSAHCTVPELDRTGPHPRIGYASNLVWSRYGLGALCIRSVFAHGTVLFLSGAVAHPRLFQQ